MNNFKIPNYISILIKLYPILLKVFDFCRSVEVKYSNSLTAYTYNVWICKRARRVETKFLIFLVVPRLTRRAINRGSATSSTLKHLPCKRDLLRLTDFTSKQIEQVIRKFSFKRAAQSTLTRNKIILLSRESNNIVHELPLKREILISSPPLNDFKPLFSLLLRNCSLYLFIFFFFSSLEISNLFRVNFLEICSERTREIIRNNFSKTARDLFWRRFGVVDSLRSICLSNYRRTIS